MTGNGCAQVTAEYIRDLLAELETARATIAALCERVLPPPEYHDETPCIITAGDLRTLTDKLAKVEAERGTAVAMLARTDEAVKRSMYRATEWGIAEGERRERAKIAAWLRDVPECTQGVARMFQLSLADAIERGDA